VPKRSLSCHVHVAFPKNLDENRGLLRDLCLRFSATAFPGSDKIFSSSLRLCSTEFRP